MFWNVTRDSEMNSYSGVDVDSDGNNVIESVGGDGLTLGNWSND